MPDELKSAPSFPEEAALDDAMMRRALIAAREARERGEIPVGAVVALGERVLAVARVERETTGDPTAHAEILALRRAATALDSWRLTGCTLYSTLEPCPMCAGAAHAAQVSRLVYATPSPKSGYAGTLHSVPADSRLNHTFPVTGGVLEAEAADLLRGFFQDRRSPKTPESTTKPCPEAQKFSP
ncbi:MAG: nucleoside deaminase [Rubrobacteraceae bacterium]